MLSVLQWFIGLGSTVFLPIIIFILGIIFGVKPAKAAISGFTVGIGSIGLNLVIGLLSATRSTVTGMNDDVIESFKRVSMPLPEIIENIHQKEAILQAWYFSDDFKHLPETFLG